MSHELRSPLNAILGFAQLMHRSKTLPAEHRENLSIISRSGEHLLTLINQVLDLSKIEAGRITLNENNFDLYRLLDDLEDMFRLTAEEKGLQLTCDRAPDVPQYIRTDEVKLRQILINLLSNAFKFTQEGGVSLRVGSREANFSPYSKTSTGEPPPLPTPHSLLFEEEWAVVLSAGCDDFLRKPLREADIFAAMNKHIGVRYIYEDKTSSDVEKSDSSYSLETTAPNIINPLSFQTLPVVWVASLKQALLNVDLDRISTLIAHIGTQDTALAQALTYYIDNFEYDKILNLIQENE